MKYYTQQDLCKEFEIGERQLERLVIDLHLAPVREGRSNLFPKHDYVKLSTYFNVIRAEAKLRLKALLIENYRGIKIKDVYTNLRRDGIHYDVVTSVILQLTTEDPLVWDSHEDVPLPDDSKWYDQCENEEELQDKRDRRDYMESTLCYGYNWWYQEHPEDDPNTQEEKNGKEKDHITD